MNILGNFNVAVKKAAATFTEEKDPQLTLHANCEYLKKLMTSEVKDSNEAGEVSMEWQGIYIHESNVEQPYIEVKGKKFFVEDE